MQTHAYGENQIKSQRTNLESHLARKIRTQLSTPRFRSKVEARGRPPFPRPTSEWWFGCVSLNLAQRAAPASPPFQLTAGSQLNSQQAAHQQTSRTARLHPNPAFHRRTAAAALQTLPGANQTPDPGEWSFLAGLNPDQIRSMGTHISDGHQKPSSPPSPPPPIQPSPKRWREEETLSEHEMDRRLAPTGSAGEPLLYNNSHEQQEPPSRRRPTPNSVRIDSDPNVMRHKTGFELTSNGIAHNNHIPPYQTSSSSATSTAILLVKTRSGFAADGQGGSSQPWNDLGLLACRWLSMACAIAITWLSASGPRHTIMGSEYGTS